MTILNLSQNQHLATLFQRQCLLLDQLLDCLEQERNLIEQRDGEQLSALLPSKNGLLQQIDSLHRDLNGWLSAAQLPSDRAQLEKILLRASQQSDDNQLIKGWKELQRKSRRCQHANSVNGHLVKQGRDRTLRLLSIILGREEHSAIYDHGGLALSHGDNRRSLGTA